MPESFGIGRAIFRAMVPDLYGVAMTANAMIREARRIGVSYRRQTMLADIRQLTGRMMKETLVTAVKPYELAKPYVMVETELSRARRYWVQGTVKYKDLVTGQEFSKEASFYADTLKTFDEWGRDYADWKEESVYRVDLEFNQFFIRSIMHNEGWEY